MSTCGDIGHRSGGKIKPLPSSCVEVTDKGITQGHVAFAN